MDILISDNTQEIIENGRKHLLNGMYHFEDYAQGVIVTGGSSHYRFTSGEEFITKPNDIVIICDRDFIVTERTPDYKITVIYVKTSFLKNMMDMEARLSVNKLFSRPRILSVRQSIAETGRMICRHLQFLIRYPARQYSTEILESYLKIFTYECLGALAQNEDSNLYDNKRENEISDKFIGLIKTNLRNSRKVSYYADKLGITPKYLSSFVKKATGRQPSQWIDEFTISEIKYRLSSSNDTMQYISYELGFATPSHMTKYFHEKTGSTPKEYRRSHSK